MRGMAETAGMPGIDGMRRMTGIDVLPGMLGTP